MNISRRGFIQRSGLAAGAGLVLSPAGLVLAELPSSRLARLSGHTLIQRLSQLGRRACIQGGCLTPGAGEGVPPAVTLLVELADVEAIQACYESEVLDGMPRVVADGNRLQFESDGIFYTVHTLLSDDYAERLAQLKKGTGIAFAHEALTASVMSRTAVSDPFKALAGADEGAVKIQFINTPDAGELEAFALLIKALIEQGCHSLDESPELALFLRLLLERLPVTAEEVDAIVAAVIGYVAVLTRMLPCEEIKELLGSPLVAEALERMRGLSWQQLEGLFTQLREGLPDEFTDGSIWLAILLSPELGQGIILPHIQTDLELANSATREDLPRARRVLEQPAATTAMRGMREDTATYEEWRRLCFGSATAGTAPTEDFDGDGTANAFEFAANSDPTDGSDNAAVTGGHVTEDGVRYMVLDYAEDRGKAGVRYEVQGTASLDSPNWSADGVEDVIVGTDGDTVHHQGRVPLGGSIRYLRLSVVSE